MKILLVEDEKKLSESIKTYLEKNDFLVECAETLEKALIKTGICSYDCILIDIMLPDGSGFEIIKEMKKERNETGIIIVSAKDSLDDKLFGLDIGADDYVTKPFHLAELNARIKSLIRRKAGNGNNLISYGNISIDTKACEVLVNSEKIELTRKEYELLLYFFLNKRRVITKETIAEHLWGDFIIDNDSFDFIYTHIKNLRKKLKNKCAEAKIETIYGIGYKFT